MDGRVPGGHIRVQARDEHLVVLVDDADRDGIRGLYGVSRQPLFDQVQDQGALLLSVVACGLGWLACNAGTAERDD